MKTQTFTAIYKNGKGTFKVKATNYLSAFDKLPTYYKFLCDKIKSEQTGEVLTYDKIYLLAK